MMVEIARLLKFFSQHLFQCLLLGKMLIAYSGSTVVENFTSKQNGGLFLILLKSVIITCTLYLSEMYVCSTSLCVTFLMVLTNKDHYKLHGNI